MPEEYVYKIVIDDADVDKTIDSIDKRVVDMTKRMDNLFKQVGSGSGAGAQQAAQQTEQAAARIVRAEQQTAQAATTGQRQVEQARQRNIQLADRELRQSGQRKDAARQSARVIRESIKGQNQELRELIKLRREEIKLLEQRRSQQAGLPPIIKSKDDADQFFQFMEKRTDIGTVQGKRVIRGEGGKIGGLETTEFGELETFDVESIFSDRKATNDFIRGLRERSAQGITEIEQAIGGIETKAGGVLGEREQARA